MKLISNISEIYRGNSDEPVYENGYILIEDDYIADMGYCHDDEFHQYQQQKNTTEYNAEGMIALPGLINTHTHAGMNLLRGYADDIELMKWLKEKIWPFESRMQSDDIYWGTKLAIAEMLQNGITTFNDMYFAGEKVVKAVAEAGGRGVIGLGLIEDNDGETGLKEAVNFIKEFQGEAQGRITTNLAPHSPYTCSKGYLQKIIRYAEELNTFLHIHIAETRDEVENMKREHNLTPVEYLADFNFFSIPVVAAHCVHLTPNDIKILADKDVSVSHNPASNMKLGSGIAPIKEMLAEGINISLGTDGVASNNGLDLIHDSRLASYLQKAVKEDPQVLALADLLQILTINGAKALNLPNLGLLQQDYQADIILISSKDKPHFCPDHNQLSNLFYAGSGADVSTVFVAGEKIVEEGKLLTMDMERVYQEINERAKKLA